MNGYQLTRRWFNFAFENSEAKVQHTALYCWMVELNNRLGWKEEFTINTQFTMEGLSIGNKNTYLAALSDLENWGFIKTVRPSINQNYGRVISLRCNDNDTATTTAMDMALIQQSDDNGEGSVPIVKQVNQETIKPISDSKPKAKRKKEKVQFVPPTIEELKDFFTERCYPLQLVDKVYNHYNDKEWHKSNGQPVIDWKATIRNNWEDHFQSWRQRQTLNVGSNNSQIPVDASQIVNYGKGNGKVFFDKKAGLWYEPLTNGYLPKQISDYYYYDQGNHSNYGDYVRWMIENDKTPVPPEDTRYFPEDWNFEKYVLEQRAIVAASNL
jgi:hypothetical protein